MGIKYIIKDAAVKRTIKKPLLPAIIEPKKHKLLPSRIPRSGTTAEN